ncbi:hypothetical protein FRB94_000117 [Tulasnella sp. JGI-2019a]|nr:hypothetical protein FRB94_000117 [Tulasnella sp. JGI-2019a]KAG9015801.1 hypothetical protein FRB93_012366 [Tulasnella sp. JGI-2019a]
MLLLWAPSITPQGNSNLAAIRFSAPVCIESIRIVPAGVQAFLGQPASVGLTAPSRFQLEVFFNQQGGTAADGTARVPANALMPKQLVFTGEMLDHMVNMGTQFSTRLMILKGDFSTLTIAIYGQLASSNPGLGEPALYAPQRLPEIQHQPLPVSIDVILMSDPTAVARQLIASANDTSASLEVALRCYCGVAQETTPMELEGNGGTPIPPQSPPIPELLPGDDEGHVVDSAIRLIKYFEEVCGVDAWDGSKDFDMEDAKTYLGIVFVFATIFWAAEVGENTVVRRGLLILRLWLKTPTYKQRLLDLELLPIYAISPLIRCTQIPIPDIAEIAHQILSDYVSNPAKLGYQGWENGLEPSLLAFLPVTTKEVRDVAGVDGRKHAMEALKRHSIPREFEMSQVVTLRLSLKWLEWNVTLTQESLAEIQDFAWATNGKALTPTLTAVLENAVNTFYRGLSPQSSTPSSSALQAQLLQLSAEICELMRYLLPASPFIQRLSRQYATQIVRVYLVAELTLQSRQGETTLVEAADNARRRTSNAMMHMVKQDWDIFPILQGLRQVAMDLPPAIHETTFINRQGFNLLCDLIDRDEEIADVPAFLQGVTAVRSELCDFMSRLDASDAIFLGIELISRDAGRVGLREWLLQHHVLTLESALERLVDHVSNRYSDEDEVQRALLRHTIAKSFEFLDGVLQRAFQDRSEDPDGLEDMTSYLVQDEKMGSTMHRCFRVMLEHDISTLAACRVADTLLDSSRGDLSTTLLITLLRRMRMQPPPSTFYDTLEIIVGYGVDDGGIRDEDLGRFRSELGFALSAMAGDETMEHWGDDPSLAARNVVKLLDFLRTKANVNAEIDTDMETAGGITLDGLSEASFQRLMELADNVMPADTRLLSSLTAYMNWSDYLPSPLNPTLTADQSLTSTVATLTSALVDGPARPLTPLPVTPPTILGMGKSIPPSYLDI